MAPGPCGPPPLLHPLVATDRLPGVHLLPSVRAELLGRLGRVEEARAEYELAVRLCPNAREQDLLRRKAAALGA
ncbi:MAG: hypothetical protein ACTHON_13510 [Humibacter sp.]